MFTIDAVMSTELKTVSPSASLADVRDLMQEHRIHHVPVVEDGGELVGLLTLTDVLRSTDSFLRNSDERIKAADVKVAEVMTTDIATVSTAASLRQAALFLEKHRIGSLPVVDDGKLVGIITDSDFVAVAINLLEQIEDTEPDEEFDEADVV